MTSSLLQTLAAFAARVVPAPPPRPRMMEIAFDLPGLREETARAAQGRWVTEDGAIHLDLRPNGRYAKRRKAPADGYQGRYSVAGTRLYFQADTGSVAVGRLYRGVLAIGEKRYRKQ